MVLHFGDSSPKCARDDSRQAETAPPAGRRKVHVRSPLAQAIRDARLTLRLTQEQLGKRLGLKGRAIYRWERDDSAPRRYHRRQLVTAIEAIDPGVATTLRAAIESHERNPRGIVVVAPPPAPAPAQPTGAVALELAIFAMADELDLPPRRLRAALVKLLARLAEAGFSLDSARRHVEARIAGAPE
jgi:transcriptional regulator with XRE-family HTH domain